MIAQTLLESIGDAIYSVAPDWTVAFFNRQAEAFFDRPRSQVVGRSLWESFPAARNSELGDGLQRVMETRTPLELVTLSPSTGRWADTRMFPLEDGGIAVSWRDVTAQKRQDAVLAEAIDSRERLLRELQTITDHIPAMLAHWDRDLTCRFANARYLEWFGRSAQEMIGLSMQALMGEALFAQNEPYIRRALAGQRQSFERTLSKPSGETGQTWAQYIPDVEPSGRVIGFYALVTDITPVKVAEERLREANIQLKAARDEAEAAAAVKTAFLANVSHELRNPLTSIIGYADLLAQRDGLDARERRYLRTIQDASEALRVTVNDLLDFSKLEAGQVQIERRPIDPVNIGLRALEMFEADLQKKGLTHNFEALRAPARVLADDTRIRQILTNLIGNAVKFTSSGSVGVRCLYDPSTRMLRYEVVDTGPGVPADRQSRLFQRFSQVDASTTRAFGGTGLGLAICKGLAEAMNGRVGVLSVPGEGSCFWAEIPAEPVGPPLAADPLPDTDALRDLRLLVVDDELANRELARLVVERFGVAVTEAGSGSEAVSAARSSPFDMILMDIRMPEIDGPAAAQIIRSKLGRNASTPIIAFTADTTGEMPAAWASLFDGMLAKPIVPAALIRLLANLRMRQGQGVA